MQKQIFSSIKSTRSNFQQISRETKSGKVVKFGVDNDFPNHLISLYNNSAINY